MAWLFYLYYFMPTHLQSDCKWYMNQPEYRYLCRIGCVGIPMRVYSRAMGGTSWNTLEAYLDAPTVRWYGAGSESGQDYAWLAGHWLSGLVPPPSGTMVYEDAFGLRVGGGLGTAAVLEPEYLRVVDDLPPSSYGVMLAGVPAICAIPCGISGLCALAGLAYLLGCIAGCRGASDYWGCVAGCLAGIPDWIIVGCGIALIGCIICLLLPILPGIISGIGRINQLLEKLCPGYKLIIAKCMREAGSDYVKLIGCIVEECVKARKPPIIRPSLNAL
ncbi:MAG: hypothetical protein KatS3mg016_2298 [Fimbriimonadales bacterium]|nr:MAG: hypothetical protein KatS3mg016_2298 [Fimbriimonadales bacterium]